MNNFNLFLIRHGQSEVNTKPDQIGQVEDVPLSVLGKEQSYKLRDSLELENFRFDKVYSSPYLRALHTSQIVCGHYISTINIVPELREYSAGDWTGQSKYKIMTPDMRLRLLNLGGSFLFPDGESLNMVERRAASWLEDNFIYNNSHNSLNIAVFSHGMTIKCILHHILGFDSQFLWKILIGNTSITKLSFGDDGWRVHFINDTSHLK
jgi:probable phosphoglycerate mutase